MKYFKGLFALLIPISISAQTPTITAVSNTSALAGASITITGTNFGATASNNSVYFGNLKGTINTASPTSISVVVPAGAPYAPIRVLNSTSGMSASTLLNFVPQYAATASSSLTANWYNSKKTVPVFKATTNTNPKPLKMKVADMDGDGLQDLITMNFDNTISIAKQTSAGVYAAPIFLSLQLGYAYDFVVADFDANGFPDIAVSSSSGLVSFFENNTSIGSLDMIPSEQSLQLEDEINGVVAGELFYMDAGDVDGNGTIDLVVASSASVTGTYSFFIVPNIKPSSAASLLDYFDYGNYAYGYPLTPVTWNCVQSPITTAARVTSLTVAKLGTTNSDLPDLLVGRSVVGTSTGYLNIYRNTTVYDPLNVDPSQRSQWAFASVYNGATGIQFSSGLNPNSITVGDLDGDADNDIVVSVKGANNVYVLLNTSANDASLTFPTTESGMIVKPFLDPLNVTIGSIDGDNNGRPEIIATNGFHELIVIKNNHTSGAFSSVSLADPVYYSGSEVAKSISVLDLNGDNLSDIVTSSYSDLTQIGESDSRIIIYDNSSQKSIPTVPGLVATPGFSSLKGNIGDGIVITGTNFNATNINNKVYFGGALAPTQSSSSTQVVATVPKGSSLGNITITDVSTGLSAVAHFPFIQKYPLQTSSPVNFAATMFNTSTTFSTVTASTNPRDVVTADLDLDGDQDVVTANSNGSLSFFSNTSVLGTVSFSASTEILPPSISTSTTFGGGYSIKKVQLVDVDGDGYKDIVAASDLGYLILIRNNTSSGSISFSTPVELMVLSADVPTSYPNLRSFATADFNKDGKIDIVAIDNALPNIYVLLNNSVKGSITVDSYSPPIEYTLGTGGAMAVAAGDIDDDGYCDFVVSTSDGYCFVYENSSDANSTAFTVTGADIITSGTGQNPFLAVSDIDGDLKPDLVVLNILAGTPTTYQISVHRNTTSGTVSFASPSLISLSAAVPYNMVVGNFDGDDWIDIGLTNASNQVVLKRNTGTSSGSISFTSPSVAYSNGVFAYGLAVADIDGDSKPDIITTNFQNTGTKIDRITVLRNTGAFALPLSFTRIGAVKKNSAIDVSWTFGVETDGAKYIVERSADGVNFSSIGSVLSLGKLNYNWLDASPLKNQNFYRVKAEDVNGKMVYSSVVRVSLQGGIPTISVAPNPVRNRNIGIQFTDMPRGSYKVDLYNAQGQLLLSRAQAHDGANAVYNFVLPAALKNGSFTLRVSDGVNAKVQQLVVE